MTCKNCGAPAVKGLCEYCSTEYYNPDEAYVKIQLDMKKAELERLQTELMARAQVERILGGL